MVIATGTGEVYQDRFDQLSRPFQEANLEQESKPEEQSRMFRRSFRGMEQDLKDAAPPDPNYRDVPFHDFQPVIGPKHIDREHHVPLLASAIIDKEGNPQGVAIHHEIPANPEHDQFWIKHEFDEARHMKDLVDAGMAPSEAYDKAHPIATTLEHDAVRAHAVRNNMDPDEYLEHHKELGRDAASIAGQYSGDRARHPDAHTTRYALDESELGHKPIQREDI